MQITSAGLSVIILLLSRLVHIAGYSKTVPDKIIPRNRWSEPKITFSRCHCCAYCKIDDACFGATSWTRATSDTSATYFNCVIATSGSFITELDLVDPASVDITVNAGDLETCLMRCPTRFSETDTACIYQIDYHGYPYAIRDKRVCENIYGVPFYSASSEEDFENLRLQLKPLHEANSNLIRAKYIVALFRGTDGTFVWHGTGLSMPASSPQWGVDINNFPTFNCACIEYNIDFKLKPYRCSDKTFFLCVAT